METLTHPGSTCKILCGVCAAAHLKLSVFSGIIKTHTSTYQGEVLLCLQLECLRESSGPKGTIWWRRGRGRPRIGTLSFILSWQGSSSLLVCQRLWKLGKRFSLAWSSGRSSSWKLACRFVSTNLPHGRTGAGQYIPQTSGYKDPGKASTQLWQWARYLFLTQVAKDFRLQILNVTWLFNVLCSVNFLAVQTVSETALYLPMSVCPSDSKSKEWP